MYKIIKELGSQIIYRKTDGAWIPFDPSNTDYQEYLRQKKTDDLETIEGTIDKESKDS